MELSLQYPLVSTNAELEELCKILWSQSQHPVFCNCTDCSREGDVAQRFRLKRLYRFFKYYNNLTSSYEAHSASFNEQALASHDDLLALIRMLRMEPEITRKDFANAAFANRTTIGRLLPLIVDQQRAISIAVEAMLMIKCPAQGIGFYFDGKTIWKDNTTLAQFVQDAFPMADHPDINGDNPGIKAMLAAKNLKKLANLKFRATDDLRDHLILDKRPV